MATHHAAPAEIVNLATWAEDLPREQSKCIAKTREMQLARLVLPPGPMIEDQYVYGPLVIHCLSGCLEVAAMGKEQAIEDGELLYLPAGERFTLRARHQALLLLTFVFPGADHRLISDAKTQQ